MAEVQEITTSRWGLSPTQVTVIDSLNLGLSVGTVAVGFVGLATGGVGIATFCLVSGAVQMGLTELTVGKNAKGEGERDTAYWISQGIGFVGLPFGLMGLKAAKSGASLVTLSSAEMQAFVDAAPDMFSAGTHAISPAINAKCVIADISNLSLESDANDIAVLRPDGIIVETSNEEYKYKLNSRLQSSLQGPSKVELLTGNMPPITGQVIGSVSGTNSSVHTDTNTYTVTITIGKSGDFTKIAELIPEIAQQYPNDYGKPYDPGKSITVTISDSKRFGDIEKNLSKINGATVTGSVQGGYISDATSGCSDDINPVSVAILNEMEVSDFNSLSPNKSIVVFEYTKEVTNTFTATANTGSATQNGSTDLNMNATIVENGGAMVTPDYMVYTDPNMLNLTNPAGITAAMSYITGGYSPGNEGLAPTVSPSQEFSSDMNKLWGVGVNSGISRTYAPVDPLVLDLNGDGVKLTDYGSAPVLFDADNDGGSLEETGWTSAQDGMVVVDRNGNGKIDNMSEMLSEYYGGQAGTNGNPGTKPFRDGFAALKSLDSNNDGVFNANDAAWNSVKVWVDANHDGKSWNDVNNNNVIDAGEVSELKTLAGLGITSINLASQSQSGEVRDGNEVLAKGTFVQNGVTKEAIAANFLANPLGHTFTISGIGTIVNTQGSGTTTGAKAYVAGDQGETIDVAAKGVQNAVDDAGDKRSGLRYCINSIGEIPKIDYAITQA